MSKIVFDESSKRFFHTGVSQGVLFVKGENGYGAGVPWNGLINVTESPEGAEETALYADNIKYLALRSIEEFKASIECYTYPDEFAECDGSKQIVPGMTVTQQERKTFAFVYRVEIGNADNSRVGYELHIVYGATASPTEKAHATVNDSPEAETFTYDISTVPVTVQGDVKSAHIVIDSRKFNTTELTAKLTALENIIYGTDGEGGTAGTDPRLPMPEEIIDTLD